MTLRSRFWVLRNVTYRTTFNRRLDARSSTCLVVTSADRETSKDVTQGSTSRTGALQWFNFGRFPDLTSFMGHFYRQRCDLWRTPLSVINSWVEQLKDKIIAFVEPESSLQCPQDVLSPGPVPPSTHPNTPSIFNIILPSAPSDSDWPWEVSCVTQLMTSCYLHCQWRELRDTRKMGPSGAPEWRKVLVLSFPSFLALSVLPLSSVSSSIFLPSFLVPLLRPTFLIVASCLPSPFCLVSTLVFLTCLLSFFTCVHQFLSFFFPPLFRCTVLWHCFKAVIACTRSGIKVQGAVWSHAQRPCGMSSNSGLRNVLQVSHLLNTLQIILQKFLENSLPQKKVHKWTNTQ